MHDCIVLYDGKTAGRLFWYPDGLYRQFDAVLSVYEGLRRLVAEDAAGNRLSLGIPQPQGSRMRLSRRVSNTQLIYQGFCPDTVQTACLLPASEDVRPVQLPGRSAAADVPPCPGGAAACAIVYRDAPPALLERFEPGRPLSLAAWYRMLTVEMQGERRFAVLPLG